MVPLLFLALLALCAGCAKRQEMLSIDKAKELLEASSAFQPHLPDILLTDEEVQKGYNAGYWQFSVEAEHHRENGQSIQLTPEGMHYFRGTPLKRHPIMSTKQELGARLITVDDIQPFPNAPDYATVKYTWTWKFENQIPELAELFKDHPPEEGKKIFHFAGNGWEISLQ